MAAHLARIERLNPRVNAIVTLVAERAMAAGRRVPTRRSRGETGGRAARPACRAQGPGRHGGHPHDIRLAVLPGSRARRGCAHRQRACARPARSRAARPTRRSSARVADLQPRLRRDPQPVGSDEDVRRQQRRRSRRARVRHGADRRRQRHRRVAAQSRRVQQRRGVPAVARPRAGDAIVVAAERARADGRAPSPTSRCCSSAIAGPDTASPLSLPERR